MKLHSFRRCPYAIRVRMVLEEKNLPYTVIEEDLSYPSEELLRLHPEGKVPLLIHEGVAIFESAVITEYLEDAFPSPALMPSAALGRAEVRLWTFWCNELLKPDLDAFKYEFKDMNEMAQSELVLKIRGHLAKLDVALSTHDYLMGAEVNLADIHVFPFYRQLQKAHPQFHELFHTAVLDAWLARMTSRPSFERVMQVVKSRIPTKNGIEG